MGTSDKTSISFGKQFKQWRQTHQITAYRIAKLTGVHASFISNIEAGRRPMSEAFMKKLDTLEELPITYDTLRAWKIQAEFSPQEVQQALEPPSPPSVPTDDSGIKSLDGLYRIPLKMSVSAGGLMPKQEHEETVYVDWYDLQTLSTDLFCMEVKGDSMWPPVPNGAILLVREVDELKNNEKYVIETQDDQMTFKLISFDMRGARLVPLNPEYTPIPLEQARIKRMFKVLSYKVDWSF